MNKTIKSLILITLVVMASCGGNKEAELVDITPEFTSSVNQFDELYPFSEGLAAVKKDGKFGYINTKGELVIPCQFSKAGAFSEGLTIVMDDEYNISILSKDGSVRPTSFILDVPYYGTGGWHYDKGYYTFDFCDKKCSIKTQDSEDEIIIDENGNRITNLSQFEFTLNDFNDFYSPSDTICHNPVLIKFSTEKENIFGNEETYYGIKDASDKIIVPAQYTHIGEYHNGVAQGIIFVGNAETKGIPYGFHLPDGEYFFGYIDSNGNTTFTKDIFNRINEYKKQQQEEIVRKEQEEREMLAKEGPDWLQGTWQVRMKDDYGNFIGWMYNTFDHGRLIVEAGDMKFEYTYTLSPSLRTIEFGNGGKYYIDMSAKTVNTNDWQEFEKISELSTNLPDNSSNYSSSSTSNKRENESRIMNKLHELSEKGKRMMPKIEALYRRQQQAQNQGILSNPQAQFDLNDAINELIDIKNEQIRLAEQLGDTQLVKEYKDQRSKIYKAKGMMLYGQ